MTPDATNIEDVEDVESFRARAREWIRANLRPRETSSGYTRRDLPEEEELAEVHAERALQRKLFDAGLAGIAVDRDYGGQGLTSEHQRAFNQELTGYEYAHKLQVPNFSPCAAVLLEFGTEEQKRRHIPPILRGETIWMQFLSEPSGGSDVAAALTTAVRDGDEWVLNGSKVWTSGAWWADWGLCLTRTNWDVPKHRGLTVFAVPIHGDGVELQRIEMLNGSKEFCQEFFTDVRIPDNDRIGEVDDGWTVGIRWMFHERMQYNSPLVTAPTTRVHGSAGISVYAVARDAGRLDDPYARDLVGQAHVLDLAARALMQRVRDGIVTRKMSDQAAALGRLLSCVVASRKATIAYELAGSIGTAWLDDDGGAADASVAFLMRQAGSIGGGTVEMARNVVSERVLGMPRERTLDKDVAFRDVPRSRPSHT